MLANESVKEKGLGKKVLNGARKFGSFLPFANYYNFRKEVNSKNINVKRLLARTAIASAYCLGGIALTKHHRDNAIEELKNKHSIHQVDSTYSLPTNELGYKIDV